MLTHQELIEKASIDELKWQTLTQAVNEIRPASRFLKDLLYSDVDPVSTEDIEIGTLEQGRETAPFVRKNGEALLVDEHETKFATVSPSNIRIKLPFSAPNLLYQRRPGTPIFSTGARMQGTAIQRRIATDLRIMDDKVTNSEELLCSQTLQGQISYQVSPNENFTITIPRPASHVTAASVFWDDANPDNPNIEFDAHTAKRIMADNPGLGVDTCLLGATAAQHFINVCKRQPGLLDKRRYDDGNVTLQTQFNDSGAIFLGRAFGIDFWEYSRQLVVGGVVTDLIRPKYAEWLHTSRAADRRMYYGAIPDITAMRQNGGQPLSAARFSKSWVQEDPSQIIYLLHSRPLPWPRRPNTWVSMQVIS